MTHRENIEYTVKRFRMVRKRFAFSIKRDNLLYDWVIIGYKDHHHIESIKDEVTLSFYINECDYLVEEWLASLDSQTGYWVQEDMKKLKEIYFDSFDNLIDYLVEMKVHFEEIIASI